MSSSSNNNINRYNLPFHGRRTSSQSTDHNDSLHSNANMTARTVSSSSTTSMMSTPSNNIRRIQEQRQQRIQQQQQQLQQEQQQQSQNQSQSNIRLPKTNAPHISQNGPKGPKSRFMNHKTTNKNVKSKLLNLSKSSKRQTASDTSNLQESLVSNHINQTIESIAFNKTKDKSQSYDFSVFIKKIDSPNSERHSFSSAALPVPEGPTGQGHDPANSPIFPSTGETMLSPPVKESQIKAWESAENMTRNLIFDDSSDSEDEEGISSDLLGGKVKENEIIKSIPGYSDKELDLVISRYNDRQRSTKISLGNKMDYDKLEEDESKVLWEFRQRHQLAQERIFAQYISMADKRKLQVAQKKELLRRVFGNNNNLNQNFITNNTSYSLNDNSPNTQLTFQEDKEEISQILEEHEFFQKVSEHTMNLMMNTKSQFLYNSTNNKRKHNGRKIGSGISGDDLEDFNNDKFQNVVSTQLDKLYEEYLKAFHKKQEKRIRENAYDEYAPTEEEVEFNSTKQRDIDIADRYTAEDNENENDDHDQDEEDEELQTFVLSYLRRCIREETHQVNVPEGVDVM